MRQIFLDTLDWCRKPGCAEEITTTISKDLFESREFMAFLRQLPVYELETMYNLLAHDMPKDPQYYIIVARDTNVSYLVDNQGYGYARYVVGFPSKKRSKKK